MFCPQCGTTQSEEISFCKQCGANMYAVRQVVATRDAGPKFDWSKTWVAEMFLSQGERKRREQELEIQRGITPEVKRYNEVKAGVITTCVGVGIMIFLYIFMQGIILGGKVPPDAAEIIRRIWVAGVIPLCIGIGLMINGLVVSRKIADLAAREPRGKTSPPGEDLAGSNMEHPLRAGERSNFIPSGFSVTEEATKQLKD